LACISLAHVGGLSVVLRALQFGSQLTIERRTDRETIESALKNGANMTSLVPTILHSVDISNFKTVLIGGAHAPTNLPSNAISTYGLTETFGGVVYNGSPIYVLIAMELILKIVKVGCIPATSVSLKTENCLYWVAKTT
jgi:O-succinylbenzoic acid--CoA ligase